MEFVDVTVPENFNLFFFGDLHDGTMLCHQSGIDEALGMLNKPYRGARSNRAILMGDYCEAIDTSDKRFDVFTVDRDKIRPDLQYESMRERLRPFKKKIDVAIEGNHDWTLKKYFPYVEREICRELDIPYGTYSCVVSYYSAKDGRMLFKVFATHGRGTIRSAADDPERVEANLNLSLKRKLKKKAGDCAIMAMGHTHLLLVVRPKKTLYLASENGELHQNYKIGDQAAPYIHPDHRYYLNTGSFRKAYARGVSDYAERSMYDPVELGFPVVTIRDGKIVDAHKEYV